MGMGSDPSLKTVALCDFLAWEVLSGAYARTPRPTMLRIYERDATHQESVPQQAFGFPPTAAVVFVGVTLFGRGNNEGASFCRKRHAYGLASASFVA